MIRIRQIIADLICGKHKYQRNQRSIDLRVYAKRKAQYLCNYPQALCFLFYSILPASFIFSLPEETFGQGTWTQKADFGGMARMGAVGFSIGNKGYIGTGAKGYGGAVGYNDFWEWDQTANTWTQKANLPGTGRFLAVGFSIGTKGYIGTGCVTISGPYYSDFWEWNQTANSWIQKANFPGGFRESAVGFSIGNKGYIGTGYISLTYFSDFWEWDQATDSWTSKTNFGGTQRHSAVGFSIGSKGYIGTGFMVMNQTAIYLSDFWEWDQATDTWTQKADFAALNSAYRCLSVGFSIGSYGYLGTGTYALGSGASSDWSKYDPFNNTWTLIADFGGGIRVSAVGFSIGCKGYVGTGFINEDTTTLKKDFWEYDPGSFANIVSAPAGGTLCIGQSATLTACCGANYSWSNGSLTNTTIVSPPATAAYSVIVSDTTTCAGSDTAFITITVNPYPAVSASSVSICPGQGATLSATSNPQAGSYVWSTGANSSSIIVNPAATSTYSVIASIWQCNDTATGTVTLYQNPNSNAGNNIVIDYGNSAVLVASGGGAYYWSTGSTSNSITVSPVQTTTYTLWVTDTNDCTYMDKITVEVNLRCPLYLPNAFSPNGDNENDFLQLHYNPVCMKSASIQIYNRWGEKVFESNDQDFKWDGTYRGKPLDAGVFAYFLKVSYWQYEDKSVTLNGNVSLLR